MEGRRSKLAFRRPIGLYPTRVPSTRLRVQESARRGGPRCTHYVLRVSSASLSQGNCRSGVRDSCHAAKSSNIHAGIIHCHSHLLLKTCWAIGTRCTHTLHNHRTCRRRTGCCNPKVGSTSRSRIWRPSMESTLKRRGGCQ